MFSVSVLPIWQFVLSVILSVSGEKCGFSVLVYLPYRTDLYFELRILGPAIKIGFEKVRNSSLQQCDINLIFSTSLDHSFDCDRHAANAVPIVSKTYYDLLDTPQPLALVLGASCSYATKELVDWASPMNLMVMDGAGNAVFLDNKKKYPTLTRWSYTVSKSGQLVVQVMRKFGWNNVVVVWNDENIVYRVIKSIVEKIKLNGDFRVDELPYFPETRGPSDLLRVITESHLMTRVVLIVGSPKEVRQMMVMAYEKGYAGGDHIYFVLQWFKTKNYWNIPQWKMDDDFDEAARKAFQSVFLIKQRIPETPAFQQFEQQVNEMALRDYNESILPYDEVNTHDLGFHDCVVAYGEIINETLRQGENMFDGAKVTRKFHNHTFYGIRGRMILDGNNDLPGNYEMWSFENLSSWTKVVDFPEEAELIEQVKAINWILGHPPPNEPFCGYDGNNRACTPVDNSMYYAVGASCVLIGVLTTVTFVILTRIQGYHERKYLFWWKIHLFELERFASIQPKAILAGSLDMKTDQMKDELVFNTAIFRGYRVYLIAIPWMVMNDAVKLELKKLRQIKCEKLVRVIGICLDEDVSCLVFEYCARGAIYDLVQNAASYTFLVDWNMRLSLIRDIVEGLRFIHQSWLKCHGKLRSTKCLMDQRFVVKLTDYALQDLKSSKKGFPVSKLNWVAPELTHQKNTAQIFDTEKIKHADIYSLGIIMSEIIWMRTPEKPEQNDSEKKILEFLGRDDQSNNRSLPDNQSVALSTLVAQCLLGDPLDRPDIGDVDRTLKTILENKVVAAADILISRMADYAEQLEEIVNQRTAALQEEHKKVEQLLFEILPRPIARSLMAGILPDPEEFDSVTVLFSCVDEFKDIISATDPLEIVVVLNEIYNLIDTTITNFSIYKVETITDIYMVASGLPVRNGIRHVAEICYFALALLDVIKNFTIHSMPTFKLRLKIGLHTGNCMAGAIGSRMPRYCLFGDMINTASRMESTSEGGKIQLTETSKDCLDALGDRSNFVLTSREKVFVKGKGDMQTYWLTAAKRT